VVLVFMLVTSIVVAGCGSGSGTTTTNKTIPTKQQVRPTAGSTATAPTVPTGTRTLPQ